MSSTFRRLLAGLLLAGFLVGCKGGSNTGPDPNVKAPDKGPTKFGDKDKGGGANQPPPPPTPPPLPK